MGKSWRILAERRKKGKEDGRQKKSWGTRNRAGKNSFYQAREMKKDCCGGRNRNGGRCVGDEVREGGGRKSVWSDAETPGNRRRAYREARVVRKKARSANQKRGGIAGMDGLVGEGKTYEKTAPKTQTKSSSGNSGRR